jgi:uncharacterized membrane protein
MSGRVRLSLLFAVLLAAQPMLMALPALASTAGNDGAPASGSSGRFVPEGTVVLFDEAHFPVYTVNPNNPAGYTGVNSARGAYAAFASVLEKIGFTVKTLDYGYTLDANSLSGVKVLVIVCSQGTSADGSVSAPYSQSETDSILNWVKNGGGLFLIGDHTSFPPAIFPVGNKFGITFGQTLLHDPVHYVQNTTTGLPPEGDVFIYFERHNMNAHPIMNNVTRVELYRTDIFTALPSDATPLIISDDDTYYIDDNGVDVPAPHSIVSAAIPSNSTAGAGRVVVIGDTNLFETDENRDDDDDADLFDSDNDLFGQQVVEWLADVPEHYGVELGSAEVDSKGSRNIVHNSTAGVNDTFYVNIQNAGNLPDTYDLVIQETTLKGWDFKFSHSAIALKSGEARVMTLTVTVPQDAVVGDTARFEIRALSRINLTANASLNCTATIPAKHKLYLECPENSRTILGGESAVYNLTLRNLGNIPENVAITTETVSGWNVSLDIDRSALGPGMNTPFHLTVTPGAYAAGGEEATVRVRATPDALMSANISLDTVTHLLQEFRIRLGCTACVQGVNPGSLASFPVSVTNLGNGPDEVTVSLVGGSPWTTYLEPSHFTLPRNATLYSTVVTRAPANSPAGDTLEVEVLGVSVFYPNARDNITLKAKVNMVNRFTLEIFPPTLYADPGGKGSFNVTVTNTGNTPDRVVLSMSKARSSSDQELPLAIGESATVAFDVPVGPDEEAWTRHVINVSGVSAMNDSARGSTAATLVVNQVHRIGCELTPSELMLGPGEEGIPVLSVWNEGNGPEVASVSLEEMPGGWHGGPENTSLNMERLRMAMTPVPIRVPAGTPVGSHALILNVTDGIGQFHLLNLTVRVLQVHNFTLSVFPPSVKTTPGKPVSLLLYVRNFGNGIEDVELGALGKQASWLRFSERFPSANRSSERQVELTVRPGPDATPGKYVMTVTGTGAENVTQQVSFTVIVQERATTRDDMPCFIGLLLIIVAAVAAYAASRKAKQAEKDAELAQAKMQAEAEQRLKKKGKGRKA